MKHNGIHWAATVKERVQVTISVAVKRKSRKIDQQVNNYQESISKVAKKRMTIVFIKPYQIRVVGTIRNVYIRKTTK